MTEYQCDVNSFAGYSLGYSKSSTFLKSFCISGLILNLGLASFTTYHLIKKRKRSKSSSLDQILDILSIIEVVISFLWLINVNSFFKLDTFTYGESDTKCSKCKQIAGGFVLFYVFDWSLVALSVRQLKTIIVNPLDAILKPKFQLLKYFITALIIACVSLLITSLFDIHGISPMLSCFINTNIHGNDIIKSIIIFIFLLLPFIIVCYGLFQMISIHKHIKLYKNNETFSLFKYYGLYIGVHLFLQFCIFLIYIIDYWEVTPSKPFKLISYLVTRLAICNPILVALVRLTQMNYNIRKFFSNCFKHKTPNNNNTERLTLIDANATEFEKLEINAIKQFVLNIYISVCYAMERSSKIINLGNIDESTCLETNEYRINKTKILQNKTSKLSSDIIVEQCDNFFIDIIEYAPKIFTYLRQIDKLNEDVIITSFLPMKNKQGIQESEGRSGNFFINTDDKRFILKTITYEDVELIRGILLEKMANHYKQHNDSIIGRIYGLYKLNITTGLFGKKEIYFILMENVYGVFENNVLCKYDLKGSQLDRKVNFDSEEIDNTVMKDVNFFEIEKGLLLNDANSRKIMTIAANDVTFLASQGIMDYSLLVVKLTFNKDETAEIFGKYHRKQTEKEVLNMLCPLTNDKMSNEDGSNDDTNINEDNLNFNRKHVRNLYKYIFPSLQPDKAYIVAIIDFFQLYDLRKKLETSFKGLRADTKIISSMPPDKYVVRFLNNLTNIAQGKEYLNGSLYTNKSHDKDKDKNKEKDNE